MDAPLSPHEAIDIGSFRVANLADLSENNLLISNQNLSEIDQKIDALIKSKTAIDTAARDSKAKKEEEAKALANKLAPDKQSANNKNSPKKLTITCVKGKSIKKFTKVKPSCPAGYKKK